MVFVDPTGRRARLTHMLLRGGFVLCIGGLALLATSLLGGVPLPGLSAPVQLPKNEPAHSRAAQPTPEAARQTVGSSAPAARGSAASSGAAAGGAAPAVAPTSSSRTARRASTSPSAARTTVSAAASPTATPSTHPRGTPSGRGTLNRHTPTPHPTRTHTK